MTLPGYDAWRLQGPPEEPEPVMVPCECCKGAGFWISAMTMWTAQNAAASVMSKPSRKNRMTIMNMSGGGMQSWIGANPRTQRQ